MGLSTINAICMKWWGGGTQRGSMFIISWILLDRRWVEAAFNSAIMLWNVDVDLTIQSLPFFVQNFCCLVTFIFLFFNVLQPQFKKKRKRRKGMWHACDPTAFMFPFIFCLVIFFSSSSSTSTSKPNSLPLLLCLFWHSVTS